MTVEVPPEDKVVEEVVTVVQELQEDSLDDSPEDRNHLAGAHRGKKTFSL